MENVNPRKYSSRAFTRYDVCVRAGMRDGIIRVGRSQRVARFHDTGRPSRGTRLATPAAQSAYSRRRPIAARRPNSGSTADGFPRHRWAFHHRKPRSRSAPEAEPTVRNLRSLAGSAKKVERKREKVGLPPETVSYLGTKMSRSGTKMCEIVRTGVDFIEFTKFSPLSRSKHCRYLA